MKKKYLSEIFDDVLKSIYVLYKWYGVTSICVTWSYGNYLNNWFVDENAQDIDFFVIYEKGTKIRVRKWLESIFGKKNVIRFDDTFRIMQSWVEIWFALKESFSFQKQVKNILSGKIREENTLWAVGWYMSEVLIHDILSCYILYDVDDYFVWLKKSIIEGLSVMKSNLMHLFTQEINYKAAYIEKPRNIYFQIVLLWDLIKQYIRYMHLQEGVLCTWLKHIESVSSFPVTEQQERVISQLLVSLVVQFKNVQETLHKN